MSRDVKHILVIRLSAMGDVAMMVPVLKAFSAQHPNIKITVLSRVLFKPMFDDIENVNFYVADIKGKHKGFFGLWKLSKALKALKIDAVADLHNVLRSNILKLFFGLQNIPVAQIDKGRTEKKELTRTEHKIFKPLKTTHQRYADVFQSLGFHVDIFEAKAKQHPLATVEVQNIVADATKKYIGIAPFAAHKGKMYPLDLMEKVINQLLLIDEIRIVFFGGGEKEKQLLEAFQDHFDRTFCAVGKFSFEEELALIARLDVMLAMDSGNAHLAAIYGVPTVTLWGVTHPFAGFAPFGQPRKRMILSDRRQFPLIPTSIYGNKYPVGYENAMYSIEPKVVVNAVLDAIYEEKKEVI